MGLLTELLFSGLDALAMLLLVATWQRTRIPGFLLLAGSYLLGLLARHAHPLLVRLLDGGYEGDYQAMNLIYQGLHFAIAVIALAGLWDIYRQLRRAPTAQPPLG